MNSFKFWSGTVQKNLSLSFTSEPLPIDSVMDILLLVAVTVYEVNPVQLTLLQLAKLLGQESVETLVYK